MDRQRCGQANPRHYKTAGCTHFEEVEKPALKSLADGLFPSFEEGPRKVHRDSYVEVNGAYYQVPVQFIGKEVWARWDAAMVRVFDLKMEQIATHTRLSKGQYSWVLGAGGCPGEVKQSIGHFRRRVIPIEGGTGSASAMVRSSHTAENQPPSRPYYWS